MFVIAIGGSCINVIVVVVVLFVVVVVVVVDVIFGDGGIDTSSLQIGLMSTHRHCGKESGRSQWFFRARVCLCACDSCRGLVYILDSILCLLSA